jgi:hypothetical protein
VQAGISHLQSDIPVPHWCSWHPDHG